MNLAWLSDLHLNFLRDDEGVFDSAYDDFCCEVNAAQPDAILISGDIAEAPDLQFFLDKLARDLPPVPIAFVLGNHDFYKGSIAIQRQQVREFCLQRPNLHYLSVADAPLFMTDRTSVIGHDGWADGRYGDYHGSDVQLADFQYIAELSDMTKAERLQRLNQLGDEAAEHLRELLTLALAASDQIIVVTHVPPFWDVCRYRGQLSSAEWVPHFACEATGNVLFDAAQRHPGQQITVLCGHTHWPARYQPRPNLLVMAAKADYGSPHLQQMIPIV